MISRIEEQIAGIIPWKSTPSGHDYSVRPNWIDIGFDFNSIPFKSDTLIIVTSWWGHLHLMEATLTNYRKTGAYIVLVYDFPVMPWDQSKFPQNFPTPKIMLLPHTFLMKHMTFDNPKRNGWLWLIYYAGGVVKSFPHFKYIFTVNSDCIWENPEGMDRIKEELGENDLMSISSQPNNIHTCAVIYKRKAFLKILFYLFLHLKQPILGSWSPEILLTKAVNKFNLREKVAPVQPMELDQSSVDHYSRYNQPSTWKDLVGYRNLGSEFITCLVEGKEPINREYVDLNLMKISCSGYSDSLLKYYETGDRRYLHQAWDHNETSWYDRVYYPIEEYGKEPIYNK